MDKSVKKVRINIPMVLTWTRIALIPLIVGVFMIPTSILSMHSQNLLGCVFFIVAAVTDALDGFIARRYGMGTTLGAFLDPVADKLMVSAALIVLLAFGRVDMLVALVIIGREITVSALREWMARVGESGKVKVNDLLSSFTDRDFCFLPSQAISKKQHKTPIHISVFLIRF